MCRGLYDCGDFDRSPRKMSRSTAHKLVYNISLHLKKQTQNQKQNRYGTVIDIGFLILNPY